MTDGFYHSILVPYKYLAKQWSQDSPYKTLFAQILLCFAIYQSVMKVSAWGTCRTLCTLDPCRL